MLKKLSLAAGSLLLCGLTLLGIDLGLGQMQAGRVALLFEPGSSARYESSEFSFTAQINELGLRDVEMSLASPHRHRILALGDSFTFGWGVALEDAWPKQLEQRLREAGLDVEVVNGGRSGDSLREYAATAERAVPLLRPDLVLVAVLQGDDLGQLVLGPSRANQEAESASAGPLAWLVPTHLVSTLKRMGRREPEDISATWRENVETFRATLDSPPYRARFAALSPTVRAAFDSANLNPALVSLAVKQPRYLEWTLNPEQPRVANAIEEMTAALRRIADVADAHGARAVVVAVPLGAYVSTAKHATYRETGFVLEADALVSPAMDDAIEHAARSAGLDFYTATRAFRNQPDEPLLFFPYDGHFTASGANLYAKSIAPSVQALLVPAQRKAVPPRQQTGPGTVSEDS